MTAVTEANTCMSQRDAACAERALAAVADATLSDNGRGMLAMNRAMLASIGGDADAAVKIYRDTLALPALDGALRREIARRFGSALATRGEFAEVLRLLAATHTCDTWSSEALALRAVAYHGLFARDLALANYEAALRFFEIEERSVPAGLENRYRTLLATEQRQPAPGSDLVPALTGPPDYPSNALRRGMEGWVQVEFDVTDLGAVENVSVAAASSELFEASAVAAVQAWRYVPRFEAGLPVPRHRERTVIRYCLDACDFRRDPPPSTESAISAPPP